VELERKEWDRVISVNLTGTFLVTKWTLKEMIKRKQGRIVNIASNCGKTGQKYLSHYSSSKHGVVGFTQSAAVEAAEHGILVNAVCPGPVSTQMHYEDFEMQSKYRGVSKNDLLEEELKTIPLRKLAQPEEIGRLVVFLVSDDNTHITGAAINISGGLEVH
jgi:NAD(P)-dependent dehydrogenase (short-subunit alcohol dehydrogenase family)